MTAPKTINRPVIGLCIIAAFAAFAAPAAEAKRISSEASAFNAAVVAGDPMSPINPYNGGTDPMTMPSDARIGVFPYSRDQKIYRVLTAPLKITTIELEKGEMLVADPAMGDSIHWEIDDDKMNHVFIKPHKADLVNTLHLTANLREYDFTLIASPVRGMFYQSVRFQYPRAPMARVSSRDDTGELLRTKFGLDTSRMACRNYDGCLPLPSGRSVHAKRPGCRRHEATFAGGGTVPSDSRISRARC
ncbi:MAG: Conjugative transfer protein TrbG [uncultured Caballeronia sp.]|nr:MAG: Conjugative transfer protein TrbG [uncultured Caballeronia sp.]